MEGFDGDCAWMEQTKKMSGVGGKDGGDRVAAMPTHRSERVNNKTNDNNNNNSRRRNGSAPAETASHVGKNGLDDDGEMTRDFVEIQKSLAEKLKELERINIKNAARVGASADCAASAAAHSESHDNKMLQRRRRRADENKVSDKVGVGGVGRAHHSVEEKQKENRNRKSEKRTVNKKSVTIMETSSERSGRSAVSAVSAASAPHVVELDADYDDDDDDDAGGVGHTDDYIPYDPLSLERPRSYTDIRDEDIGGLNWSFIDRAYLLIPDNVVSARTMAERNLIQAGLGSKLHVCVYRHAPEDPERARWEAHRKVAVDGMDKGFARIAVFEHDARCVRVNAEMLAQLDNELNSSLPQNWRLYLLGHDANFCQPINEISYRLLAKHNFAYIASDAYMDWLARLSPEKYAHHPVAKIISWFSPNNVVPHDLAVALCTQVYGIVPPIVCQRGQEANVDGASMTMFVNPFLRYVKLAFDFCLITTYDYVGCLLFP